MTSRSESTMSAEWWKREADRYCRLHIEARQRLVRLEGAASAVLEIYDVFPTRGWRELAMLRSVLYERDRGEQPPSVRTSEKER